MAQGHSAKMDSLLQSVQQQKDPLKRSEQALIYAQHLNAQSTDRSVNFMDSLINYYKDEDLSVELGRAQSMKAWFLCFQAQYEPAIRLGYKALAILKQENDSLGVAQTLNRVGLAHMYFNKLSTARNMVEQALQYFIKMRDTARIDMMLNNLGVISGEQNDHKSALDFYKRSLSIRKQLGNYHWIAYSYFNIATSYLESGELDSARVNMLKAVDIFRNQDSDHDVPSLASAGVGEMYQKRGEWNKAIEWYKKALVDARQMKHTEVVIMAKKGLAEVYYAMGRYREAYDMNQAYQKMQATVDSTNSEARVVEMEQKYKNAEKEAEIARLRTENLAARTKAQRSWVLAMAVISAASLLIFTIMTFYQKRLQKQRLQQSELKAQISDMRMIALRAQMNPHFIFNCINTTQNFVLNSEKEAAYNYLAKFASLLRLVLENSGKSMVPLEDELEQLALYLELEAIRFNRKFSYSFEVDPALENGVYEIPGMILQPLIENAILHGLINRNDNLGTLIVRLQKREDTIVCTIKDNGVGRRKAAEIKSRKKIHYQSSAIPNIRERLEILQRENEQRIQLEIADLTESGEETGTRVSLTLPFQ